MSKQTTKPKGILKKATPMPPPTAQNTQNTQNAPDAREVAVKHARIIHSRRDVEDQIADSMIELSKYPLARDPPRDASDPAPADAESFKNIVRLYQPSDYDDLVEERNANGLCGYTLCPSPRSRVSGGGTFKLVNYGRKDFNIVPSRELEKWCSQKCAKRAMYVKVQLNETAAWERAGIPTIQVDLLEEPKPFTADDNAADNAADKLAKDVENLKIEAQEKTVQNARDLLLERGDPTGTGKPPKRTVKLAIREKPVEAPAAPTLNPDDQGHLITEGYKTTFDAKSETVSQEVKVTAARETKPNGSPPFED
ncbi:Rtr1/RPAP2 family-domain-containing protein [Astrocystis sublimbata]|nr:Rtr1/RPAP2 family-domain-containing protein [Astrocystis sublimbata]